MAEQHMNDGSRSGAAWGRSAGRVLRWPKEAGGPHASSVHVCACAHAPSRAAC